MVNSMLEKAQEIFNKNKDIKYGWTDKNGKVYEHIREGLPRNFHFQSYEELEKSRVGICWETVELDKKYLLDANIPCKTYFFVIPNLNFYCHSVLVFKENNKYYWLENSFKELTGIREYNNLQELFNDVMHNFNAITHIENPNLKQLKIFEYNTPKFGIGCVQFYFHCFKGKNITKNYVKNYLKSIDDKTI